MPKNNIITYDRKGNPLEENVNDLLAKDKNHFTGWKCFAGIQSLYIDPEGDIYRATCKEDGKIGNIEDEKIELPEDLVICSKNACNCASDIELTKYLMEFPNYTRLSANTFKEEIKKKQNIVKNKIFKANKHTIKRQFPKEIEKANLIELHNFKKFIKEYSLNSETFCILPFIHQSTTTSGEIKACCRSKTVHHVDEVDSITDSFYSKEMNQLRSDIFSGVKNKICSSCWEAEALGRVPKRAGANLSYLEKYKNAIEKPKLIVLEAKLSNICNLKCKMCSPLASTKWLKDWKLGNHSYTGADKKWIDDIIKKYDMYKNPILNPFSEKINSELIELTKNIRELQFAGGEPLLDPDHWKLLEAIQNKHEVDLKYSTNLTSLGVKNWNALDIWPKFKSVDITISIDGHERLTKDIREGLNTDLLLHNLKTIRKRVPNITNIKSSVCISSMNIGSLRDTLDYIFFDLNTLFHWSYVSHPESLAVSIKDKEKINKDIRELKNLDLDKIAKEIEIPFKDDIEMNKSKTNTRLKALFSFLNSF